jgi:aconitate hydratase
MGPLCEDIALKVASVIRDPVTTTDELIPSGETSAYRSDPMKLAEFALSRKDPQYVKRAKAVMEDKKAVTDVIGEDCGGRDVCVGSAVYAESPGDGSAREQAASVQKVLGGWANICISYATKRYRSNLINWGILPFTVSKEQSAVFETDDIIYIRDIRKAVAGGSSEIKARLYKKGMPGTDIVLSLGSLTKDERDIILDGCLINYYRNGR